MAAPMFIRKRPIEGTSHFKIQICESLRTGSKVVQKTIKQVGTARDEYEMDVLMRAAELIMHGLETSRRGGALFNDFECLEERKVTDKPTKEKSKVHIEDLKEVERTIEGPVEIFGHAFEAMKLNGTVKIEKEVLLKNLIAARITDPSSKRRTQKLLQKHAGFHCSLDSIYRLLTELGACEDIINKAVFNSAKTLFDSKIDLMFFDVTTLYYESIEQDELRDFGYSKDCKFGQVQVTLALAAQKDGFPIGYKLFPGNTAEVATLISCVEEWRKNLAIDDVIFVADRGMFSAKNLCAIADAGFKFVIGCPLRKLGKQWESHIFNESNFRLDALDSMDELFWNARFQHSVSVSGKPDSNGVKQTSTVNGNLVVCYSSKRAKKDSRDREVMIEKARKKYEKKSEKIITGSKIKDLIGNKGYTKYLKVTDLDGAKVSIDEKKVEQDAKWDGLSGIFTNAEMSNLECLARYRGLWQIEECFRISKSHLKIRPIFHFSPERIRGHIALCFMSLAVLKYTQLCLLNEGVRITIQSLTDELMDIGSTLMEDKFQKLRFRVPTPLSDLGQTIYKSFGLKRSATARPVQ